MFFEDENYAGTKIIKAAQTDIKIEPYVLILAVSDKNYSMNTGSVVMGEFKTAEESAMDIKPGNYCLTRPKMGIDGIELWGKTYALISEHDIYAVVTKEVTAQIKNERQRELNKAKIELVN